MKAKTDFVQNCWKRVDFVAGSGHRSHLPEETYLVPPVLRKVPCSFSYLECDNAIYRRGRVGKECYDSERDGESNEEPNTGGKPM